LLAKAEKKNFEKIYKSIIGNQSFNLEDIKGEKKGYAYYASLLVYRIAKIANLISDELFKASKTLEQDFNDKNLVEFLNLLLKYDQEVSSLILPYLNEIKQLSEAFFEEEGGKE